MTKLFKTYALKNYCVSQQFIDTKYEEYELDELAEILEHCDSGYHFRISKTGN